MWPYGGNIGQCEEIPDERELPEEGDDDWKEITAVM
jgi:hypothetical protein